MDLKTTHNLPFEAAEDHFIGTMRFRIGTCEGQWGSTKDSFWILSITNKEKGNGHLDDVFEWFEHSCKRDGKNLIILEVWNERLYKHLINKRGFVPLDPRGDHVIKIFNKNRYKKLLKHGNEMLTAKTLYSK